MPSSYGAGYLLDTNVISETRVGRPNEGVQQFIAETPIERVYLSVLTVGELLKGLYRLQRRKPEATSGLTGWIGEIQEAFRDRLLVVDAQVTELWARFTADRDRSGIDTLLAATAVAHDLTLVTRNLRDFEGLPVRVLNPWSI